MRGTMFGRACILLRPQCDFFPGFIGLNAFVEASSSALENLIARVIRRASRRTNEDYFALLCLLCTI